MKISKTPAQVNRRVLFKSGIATATALMMPTPSSSHQALDQVMGAVVPHIRAEYSIVRTEDLRRLCDEMGVQFAPHWAQRRAV